MNPYGGEMSGKYYLEHDTNLTLKDISHRIRNYWIENDIFSKVNNQSRFEKTFRFLEGPPTANGRPHVGHALTRTVKDTVLRYKNMRGFYIDRRNAGWDCHGLPVELEAEKHFGFKTKKDIEDFGIEKFNDYCKTSIFNYINEWHEVDNLLGFWIDQDKAYITMTREYMESEWWALKTLFEKKLLYKDFRISPYCPRCETSLSSHEVAQGYKEVKDPSIYVKFKVGGESNRYLLAWTTTPWTIPSNMFLAVNERFTYALIKVEGEEYIIAKERIKSVIQGEYEIIGEMSGKELIGIKYERPVDFLDISEDTCYVVSGEHVTLEDGTGIVHTSPAFGVDDFQIGKLHNIKILNPVGLNGKFNDKRLPWFEKFVKDADIDIIKYLKEKKLLYKSTKITHTYPFCYRCGTPLLYYPVDAWFIGVSNVRTSLVNNNKKINWIPDHLKEGRFGNFISEAKDWNLSRNRYWGNPLPVWVCQNNHQFCMGSASELEKLYGHPVEDLHRPFIDEIKFKCPECGESCKREPFVIDTWFDSGSAPFAALHYPFENNQHIPVPVDFITEGIDQTRGWFYSLHVISSLLFKENAYNNAFVVEFILDSEGRKMSKSKGNSVFALDLINQYGPDSSRLFFFNGPPWKPKPLSPKIVQEISTKTLGTFVNLYSFFASNANLDNFQYKGLNNVSNRIDRWLVSVVNSVGNKYLECMDSYEIHDALRHIMTLIDLTSNFYLRLSRRRFWEDDGSSESKEGAYSAFFYSLNEIAKMLAPLAPFTADYVYMALNPKSESVHFEQLKPYSESLIDKNLEREMDRVKEILELTRRARQNANIKGRKPVEEILIHCKEDLSMTHIEPIIDELNAHDIKFIEFNERPVMLKASVNKVVAAPILREKITKFENYLNEPDNLKKVLAETNSHFFEGIELPLNSINITEIVDDAFIMERSEKESIEIYVNKKINRELELEGLSREVIRRIQVMRKEALLEYNDEIKVTYHGDSDIEEAIDKHKRKISTDVQAKTLARSNSIDGRNWDIDGRNVSIKIEKC
ncbi:MAG: hypothetical protein AMDU2_EPLC00008G0008 [Thermoplasmatales archaeon E-plasma]|nr:MAG: hypothetical protein AMDU2_EPLC00008G0008 [Thermoplasmatales archaeon E-plasma]